MSGLFGSNSPQAGAQSGSARARLSAALALIAFLGNASLPLCANQAVASGQMMRPSPTPSTSTPSGMPSSQVNSSAASKPATAPSTSPTPAAPTTSPSTDNAAAGASTQDIITPQTIPDPPMQTQVNEKTPGDKSQPGTAPPKAQQPGPNRTAVQSPGPFNIIAMQAIRLRLMEAAKRPFCKP